RSPGRAPPERFLPKRTQETQAIQAASKTRKRNTGWPRMTTDLYTSRKTFAGRKGFFFAKSSRSWRSSRLRGESWVSPRRREAREENAKDSSLVAAGQICVHSCSSVATFFVQFTKTKILSSQRRIFALAVRKSLRE